VEEDPKLKEFLNVMQAPSKSRTWANDDIIESAGIVETSTESVPNVPAEDAESDAEYQTVSKKPKKKETERPAKAQSDVNLASNSAPERADTSPERLVDGNDSEHVDEPGPATTVGGPEVSDADWLRSRTSRLLGLENDGQVDGGVVEDLEGSAHDGIIPEVEQQPEVPNIPVPKVQEEEQDASSQENGPTAAIKQSGRLFVRNLPYNVTEDDLREHFMGTGSPQEVRVSGLCFRKLLP